MSVKKICFLLWVVGGGEVLVLVHSALLRYAHHNILELVTIIKQSLVLILVHLRNYDRLYKNWQLKTRIHIFQSNSLLDEKEHNNFRNKKKCRRIPTPKGDRKKERKV